MKAITLDRIHFTIDEERLLQVLRVSAESDDADAVRRLAAEAEGIARPKAVFREAYIDQRRDAGVVIDGVAFKSRVLAVNLENAHRAFPYVATCGAELGKWANSTGDILARWWADGIMQTALSAALAEVNRRIDEDFQPGKTAAMNPGSLADWPIEEQKPLFSLLGDVKGQIGVTLTESFLMIPAKSVSGLRFPTETTWENCQLCPREGCSGRRAPYDAGLHALRYNRP